MAVLIVFLAKKEKLPEVNILTESNCEMVLISKIFLWLLHNVCLSKYFVNVSVFQKIF